MILSLAAYAAIATARAQVPQEEEIADITSSRQIPAAPPRLPVEQILEAMRESLGAAFIFDSRLIDGKTIRAINPATRPESELDDALTEINLRVQRIAPKTYAITRRDPPAPPIAPAAQISPENAQLADTILVMGTMGETASRTGSKRIFNIETDDIAYLDVTSPAEAIFELPQALASVTPANTVLLGPATGLSLADLRGLEPKRTLVLVNGRRRALSPGGNGDIGGVDLTAISQSFLERIEIQNSPGGARFADAAVSGTINFVTKTIDDGVETGAQIGISERGDSEVATVYAMAGFDAGERSMLSFAFNVSRTGGLIGADRSFSATPFGLAIGDTQSTAPGAVLTPGIGGSASTGGGIFVGAVLPDGSPANFQFPFIFDDQEGITLFANRADQLFNWAEWQTISSPNDRLISLMTFETRLSDSLSLSISGDGSFSRSEGQLAPIPGAYARGVNRVSGDAAIIPVDNPFLPPSIVDFAKTGLGADIGALIFQHRFNELGPRRTEVSRRDIALVASLNYLNDAGSNIDLSYRYGANRTKSLNFGHLDFSRLSIALDPIACANSSACALVDFFGSPEISSEALDFIAIPEIERRLSVSEHEFAGRAEFELSIDDMRAATTAFGASYLYQTYSDRDSLGPDALPVGYIRGIDTRNSIKTFDVFAQMDAQLIRSVNFPREADLSAAIRLTDATSTRPVINVEVAVDFSPLKGVSLFSRQSFGGRTPNLLERFSGESALQTAFVDPCGLPLSQQHMTVRANCASAGPLGVPQGFLQTQTHAASSVSGNPYLEPEKIRSALYGFHAAPTDMFGWMAGRMDLAATWRGIRIRRAIMGQENVIARCYRSENFTSVACGSGPEAAGQTIVRDPVTRQITSFDRALQNEGEIEWKGLDLELRYSAEPNWPPFVDTVWLSALHTFTARVTVTNEVGSATRLDGLIDHPRHRTLASIGADIGRLRIGATMNRRGRALTQRVDLPEAAIPPEAYFDLSGSFSISDAATIQLGFQNIFDNEPEITAFNEVGNFAPEYYDPVGRSYRLTVRANF